ncbi:protein FAM47A-like [Hydractinia symbiolongicarpus]|uniref:protein FAM47A-like n=1 Tax=Hydractinia symbiolongicarpus TaxID=13093 RepID=UPI00254D203E|nr:protein FAM47A-like [Hydractinia symbiolongicarpus]
MAEKKYELVLGPRRDSSLKIRHQPWYRERLNTKYDHKPPLIASSWTFLKDGLDDFRDGKPPPMETVIIKGTKGITPNLFGSDTFIGKKSKQRLYKGAKKEDAVFSKCLPNQEKRKQKVQLAEDYLLNHPLALYPHIEDSVPPDLFEDIVDLLDPSLALAADDFEEEDVIIPNTFKRDERLPSIKSNSTMSSPRETCSDYNIAMKERRKNCRKLNKKIAEEEANKEDKSRSCRKKTQPHLTKIEGVTKDFCNWVRDLGGTTNNIEEATINNLFASGYDTKPTLSVPVHVVELTNVPPELRADGHMLDLDNDDVLKSQKETSYTPKCVNMKYGAWYLNPKTWKIQPFNQPLQDPKEIESKQISEAKKNSKELDQVLSNLHGAKSFRSFIEKKGVRNPEFLEGVSTDSTNEANIVNDAWNARTPSVAN